MFIPPMMQKFPGRHHFDTPRSSYGSRKMSLIESDDMAAAGRNSALPNNRMRLSWNTDPPRGYWYLRQLS
jgi:hypothetical protein